MHTTNISCLDKCVWLSQLHHISKCMTITPFDVQRMYEVPKGYYGGMWCIYKGNSFMMFNTALTVQ